MSAGEPDELVGCRTVVYEQLKSGEYSFVDNGHKFLDNPEIAVRCCKLQPEA